MPVTKNNLMDFYQWSFKQSLNSSNQGIPEPFTIKVFPDVLLVPLVGFDKKKFRLGYGGGFYDRYIARYLNLKKLLQLALLFRFRN